MNIGQQYIPVSEVDKRIVEVEELLHRLPVELAALKRLRAGAVLVDSPSERVEIGEKSAASINSAKLGPRAAVVSYLRRNPRATTSDVVRMLANDIRTKASDPKRVVISTIYNLVKNGTLQKDHGGCLTVSRDA